MSRLMKEIEETVIKTVRGKNLISRADIARSTGLSKPVVSRIIAKFIDEGIVKEERLGESSVKGGKKPILMSFAADCKNFIGIDFGGNKITAVLTNLDGEITESVKIDSRNINDKIDFMAKLFFTIDHLISLSKVEVTGIGIAICGTTNMEKGYVYHIPVFKLKNLHLKKDIEKKYGIPVTVCNDVTSTAYGEMWKGAATDFKNVFLVHIGTGTGSGLIIDGKNYTGAHNYAGEIGYMITDWSLDKDVEDSFTFGHLENWISGSAFEKKGGEILGRKISAKDFFDFMDKDERLRELFNRGCEHFALLMANVITLIDPEIIIVSGGVGYNRYEMIKSTVEPVLNKILPREMVDSTVFKKAELGDHGVVMGAVFLAQRQFFMNL